jgi:hypothetical protein
MKKVMLLMASFLAFGVNAFAQDEDEGGVRWLNEFSFHGELVARTQVNMDGTAYAGLDNSELHFSYRFTEYSGVVYNMRVGHYWIGLFGGQWNGNTGMNNDWSTGPVVHTDHLYAYTDILGEIGANDYIGLGFKIGIMGDGSEFRGAAHAMDFGFETGDGFQSDWVRDRLNIRWDIPIHALNDIFPLKVWIIHDADFSRSNNDFSISAHIESTGMTLVEDRAWLDWNAYYNYKGGMETGNNNTPGSGAGALALESHSIGLTMGSSIRVGDNMYVGLGFGVDYRKFGHGKEYSGAGVHWHGRDLEDTARALGVNYLGQFGYVVGARFYWGDMFRFNFAYRGRMDVNGVIKEPGVDDSRHHTQYWASSIAVRFDLLSLSRWVELYGGMSFDLRTNEQMKEWYGETNYDRKVYFSDRIGLDVGAVYTGWSNMRIYLGYFWGNLSNGGIEDTHHTTNGDTTIGARRTDKIGNHMYIKAKFYF